MIIGNKGNNGIGCLEALFTQGVGNFGMAQQPQPAVGPYNMEQGQPRRNQAGNHMAMTYRSDRGMLQFGLTPRHHVNPPLSKDTASDINGNAEHRLELKFTFYVKNLGLLM